MVTKTPSAVFRGDPPTALHEPDPREIVTLLDEILTEAETATEVFNADGGLTMPLTETTVDIAGAFGGTWKTANRIATFDDTGGVAGSRTTAAFMRDSVGSGSNGPANADYALHVESKKADYLTSSVLGEIDGASVVVRQGAAGDASGVMVNIHQVENASYGMTSFEAAASIVDGSGTKLQEMKATIGAWIQGAADLRGGGFGYMVRPADDGYTISHGVLVMGYSSAANTGITTAFRASATMAAADTYFLITGDENEDGGGLARGATGSAAAPSWSFYGDADTGMYRAAEDSIGFSTGGTLRMAAGPGLRVGTGLTDPGAGIVSAASGFKLPAFTSTQIADATHAVNTTNKAMGLTIWDSTNNRMVTAGGSTPTANWYVGNGTVAITPA